MTIATFIFFTALVAVLTWWFTRGTDLTTGEGYFLAGRSLTGIFIAGSLLLTNLSTEQLIGLNAGSFNDGLSLMCWEVIAGISLVIMGLFFLPRYLKSGITTIPQFLEERFGPKVRSVVAAIFIVAYMAILLPLVLYLGANGLNEMLELEDVFGLSEIQTIWAVIVLIAILGAAYAILGGLKAIAVSDTFNGAGLLIGGLLITILAWNLVAEKEGGHKEAFTAIQRTNPDAFKSLGVEGEDTYWPTLFTGVLLLNFFYWSSNQQIIQRTFGAKNLAEGQKGVLIAAFFKILAPLILILPGILAAHLIIGMEDSDMIERVGMNDDGEWNANNSYGALVARVLPPWLLGFFAAVIVGSILSTFNSVLNSAATLFSLDVYAKYIHPKATTHEIVRSGRFCSFLVGLFAVIAAPLIFHGRDGVFGFFQKLNGVYFIPLLAVILIGLFNRRSDGRSAMTAIIVGLVLMMIGTFLPGDNKTGWMKTWFGSGYHYMGAVFLVLIALQLIMSQLGFCLSKPYVQKESKAVDLTPWRHAKTVGLALVIFALTIYLVFAF